jgi:hypothetical protein
MPTFIGVLLLARNRDLSFVPVMCTVTSLGTNLLDGFIAMRIVCPDASLLRRFPG